MALPYEDGEKERDKHKSALQLKLDSVKQIVWKQVLERQVRARATGARKRRVVISCQLTTLLQLCRTLKIFFGVQALFKRTFTRIILSLKAITYVC